MKKRLLFAFVIVLLAFAVLIVWLRPSPKPRVTPQQLRAEYIKGVQRLYRHEILSLYQPPEEAFTAHGLELLREIQGLYSPVFVPYLVMGSVPVQPDVLFNPWYDVFILVADRDGQIDSVVLASSLAVGQSPQLELPGMFWRSIYQRYQAAQITTFANPKPFENERRVVLEMRNLTNQFGWPRRLHLTGARVPFDLYIQRPTQAIYCSPTEPGTFVVYSYHTNQMHTNVIALPPYQVREAEKLVQESIDRAKNAPKL